MNRIILFATGILMLIINSSTDVLAQKKVNPKKLFAFYKVIYECSTEIDPEREKYAPESIRLIANRAENILKNSRSILILNKTHSYNYAEMTEDSKDMSAVIAKSIIRGDIEFFTDLNNKSVKIRQKTPGEFITLIKDDKIEWQITKDSVKINGMKCIKAFGIISIPGFNDTKIIAWFTSDLPISMGPHGLHGLPGLILKYREGSSIFTAKSINDIKNQNIVIEHPSSTNLKTYSETLTKGKKMLPKK